MSSAVLTLFSYIFILLEVWIITSAATAFFTRSCSMRFYVLSLLGLTIMESLHVLMPLAGLSNGGIIKWSIDFLIIFVWARTVYGKGFGRYCFFSLFILAYITAIDLAVMVYIAKTHGDIVQYANAYPTAYFLICCFTKFIEIVGIMLLRAWMKTRHIRDLAASVIEWLRLGFFPLASLGIGVVLFRIMLSTPALSGGLSICMVVLLLVDLLSVYLLDKLDKTQAAARENAVLRQNLKLEAEHFEALQDSYEQQRRQTHNYYDQLSVLKGMAERGASQEDFSKYLDGLIAAKEPTPIRFHTHRTTVDVLLSQKASKAHELGIEFDFQFDDLAAFPLPDNALVVILSNLIDNAMDACGAIPPDGQRYIRLSMKMRPAEAWLCIENTTAQPVKIENNMVQTTKGDPLERGYGLKIVASLLAENGGTYTLNYLEKERLFGFYSTIPCPEKTE